MMLVMMCGLLWVLWCPRWVGLVSYFQMLVNLILGQVSVPVHKLEDSIGHCGADAMDEAWGLVVLRSTPHLWLPFSGMALPAAEFTHLHYICCGSASRKDVGDCPRNTLIWKNRREIESLGGITSLSCPYQDSSEGHAGHCPSILLSQIPWVIILFFVPLCIIRTYHERLETSLYHFWHKYKSGAVLLAFTITVNCELSFSKRQI